MSEIQEQLPAIAKEIHQELQTLLEKYAVPQVESLYRAMLHSLLAGGKRIRPAVCLLTCEALGGRREQAMPAALALELIHTYSLIHDDLPAMDDDHLRRGQPTCHVVYGEAMAILAGDALQAMAFEQLAECTPAPPWTCNDLVRELARRTGPAGMVGGQCADIEAEGKPVTPDTMLFIHEHKTADLLTASLRLGAMCAGASKEDVDAIGRAGYHIGLAFQFTDDLLNATHTSEQLGKPVGTDEDRDKCTVLAAWGLEKTREEAAKHTSKARQIIADLNLKTDLLAQLTDALLERDR